MAAPNYHNYAAISGSSVYTRVGVPGKYHSAAVVATTNTASFTDASAFMVGASANDAATKITVANGGVIAGNDCIVGTLYEIGVSQVQSTGGNIFVFKRGGK